MLNCYYGDVVAVIVPVLDDRALPSVTKHYQALESWRRSRLALARWVLSGAVISRINSRGLRRLRRRP